VDGSLAGFESTARASPEGEGARPDPNTEENHRTRAGAERRERTDFPDDLPVFAGQRRVGRLFRVPEPAIVALHGQLAAG